MKPVISLALSLLCTISTGQINVPKMDIDSPLNEETLKFAEAIEYINQFYIQPVTYSTLIEHAIQGMVQGLDPHSEYLDKKALSLLQTATDGRFVGIGIELDMDGQKLHVISPIDNSPAKKAGIQSGDIITQINFKPANPDSLFQNIIRIRGKEGTEISLTIQRNGKEFDKTLTRSNLQINHVSDQIISEKTGIIQVSMFSRQTPKQLTASIKDLLKQSIQGLVIDLRDNPGGLLDSAIHSTDLFLDAKEYPKPLIVTTKGKHRLSQIHAYASDGDIAQGIPIVVLVNEGSASAAEIFASALQDHHRALIVGRKTFGKGSIQTLLPLGKNSALKLTTALYYSPTGKLIEKNGVKPDVYFPAVQISTSPSEPNAQETDHLTPPHPEKPDNPYHDEIQKLATTDYMLFQAVTLMEGLFSMETIGD